jgi:hypothetical protein
MSDHYDALTEGEAAHWDEYERLRELSDWPGFTAEQDARRQTARDWLVAKRKQIWRLSQPAEAGGDGLGWDHAQRSERYAQLADDSLNGGSCRRVASLPRSGCTDAERALLAERCTWWLVTSTTDEQKRRKQDCTDWLIARRKQLYGLIQDGPEPDNEANYRHDRYANLSIATKHGDVYENWCQTHDPTTGEALSSGSSARETAVERCRSYLGVSENPPESNRGSAQPDDWQERVLGYSGNPWCACFSTCMAWDAGVKGSSSAAVQYIVTMAQNHEGMFSGWTTDPADVLRGDMIIIGCTTCHVGMVVDSDDPYHSVEGNTSPGSEGSQYNGGCVAERQRPHSDVIGWALVDYPD